MTRTRPAVQAGKPSIEFRPTSARGSGWDVLAELRRLTPRDRRMLALLAEHQVLTGDQLARLVFDNPTTARHRLVVLARRGVLARFRHYQRPGSQAWRYVLGSLGAALHAATLDTVPPAPSRVAERAAALAASPRLGHLLAVNEFFVQLAHHARTHPGTVLAQWWPEKRATARCAGIAHPDGAGEWHEHPPGQPGHASQPGHAGHPGQPGRVLRVAFWLELDRGTEPIQRLVDKLTGYRHLTEAGLSRPLLIVVPTTTRERHVLTHPALATPGPQRVATTTTEHLTTTGLSPADTVWRLAGAHYRTALINLGDPP